MSAAEYASFDRERREAEPDSFGTAVVFDAH